MVLEVMLKQAMNRTTTNQCLIVFDFYWLDEFSLLPELHAVTVFSNCYGHGYSPVAKLKCYRLFRPQFRKFNPRFVSRIP